MFTSGIQINLQFDSTSLILVKHIGFYTCISRLIIQVELQSLSRLVEGIYFIGNQNIITLVLIYFKNFTLFNISLKRVEFFGKSDFDKKTVRYVLMYFIYSDANVIERFFARVNVFCHGRLTVFLSWYSDTAKCLILNNIHDGLNARRVASFRGNVTKYVVGIITLVTLN